MAPDCAASRSAKFRLNCFRAFAFRRVEAVAVQRLPAGGRNGDQKVEELRHSGVEGSGIAAQGGHQEVAQSFQGGELGGGEEARFGLSHGVGTDHVEVRDRRRRAQSGWGSGGWSSRRRRGGSRLARRSLSEKGGRGRHHNERFHEAAAFHLSDHIM